MNGLCNRLTGMRLWAALIFLAPAALFAAPVAVISASPLTGNAPLGVFFDGTASTGAVSYFWDFGDGAGSTASAPTHIYTVAGTYTATLTVVDAQGVSSPPASIVITVNGSGQGVVTPGMNFRIAPFKANFLINRTSPNSDKFILRATFNSVDLPGKLLNLAASFSINNKFTVVGTVRIDNSFQNPDNDVKPTFFNVFDVKDQLLTIEISRANLATALGATGAVDQTITTPIKVPVTFNLTIGAQSYNFTQNFDYTALQGSTGTGTYDLAKRRGNIGEGFFVVSLASAIETPNSHSHFFVFTGYLTLPNGVSIVNPTTGNCIVTFNQADPIVIPFDRFTQAGPNQKIVYLQPQRGLGGIRSLSIDPLARTFSITTWDVPSDLAQGGTGLPTRGEAFTSFNFALRMDLDQPTGTALHVVTATQLSRKSIDDAFWQTGRKKKPQ